VRTSVLMWAWCLGVLVHLAAPASLSAQAAPTADAAHSAATDEEARVHFRLGTAYYDSGRFAQAAQEFKQAYELSKRPQLLYNLFLAYRDAGDIHNAASALRQYLKDNPEVEERSKLEARLQALDKILEGQPAPQAQPTPAQTAPGPVSEPAAQQAAPAPTQPVEETDKLKWLPWTLIGSGAALIVGGVVTGALAKSDESELDDKCPNGICTDLSASQVDDLKSSGTMKAALSDVLTITGAVTAGVGVAFLFWKPWKKQAEAPSSPVNVACGSTGCAASWSGRF
jgi:hypothetical protein